jgi:hypothetical protein
MSKLNRLKFELYSNDEYYKDSQKAVVYFRSVIKYEDALGYDIKSDGYLVLHKQHSPSGLENEIPVCLILKKRGVGVELIAESITIKSGDVAIQNIIFEIKRLKKGTNLSGGIQNHFRRAKEQSENLILHIDHKVDTSNLKRSIRNAAVKYKNIKFLMLVYLEFVIELRRDDMLSGQFEIK